MPVPGDMEGRSLLGILTGAASPGHHRDYVRTESYDSFNLPNRTWGTMYRDQRWKLIVYHGDGVELLPGEFYDMENDPSEFTSLWDSPEHQSIKIELLRKSFDASVRAIDYGPPRVMPY